MGTFCPWGTPLRTRTPFLPSPFPLQCSPWRTSPAAQILEPSRCQLPNHPQQPLPRTAPPQCPPGFESLSVPPTAWGHQGPPLPLSPPTLAPAPPALSHLPASPTLAQPGQTLLPTAKGLGSGGRGAAGSFQGPLVVTPQSWEQPRGKSPVGNSPKTPIGQCGCELCAN